MFEYAYYLDSLMFQMFKSKIISEKYIDENLFTSLEKSGRFLEQDISAALFRKDFLLNGNLIGRILAAEGDRRVVWHDVLAAAGHFGFIEDTFLTREK